MRVVVTGSGLSWSAKRFVIGLPAAVGALVIAVVTVGPLASAIALLVGVPAVFLLLEGVARVARARVPKRALAPGLVLAAEASVSGVPGTVTVSSEAIEWRSRRAGDAAVNIPVTGVSEVVIRPIRLLFFRAARVAFTSDDGRVVEMAVTAPAQEVRAALASSAPD
jgi:hypothetical protein